MVTRQIFLYTSTVYTSTVYTKVVLVKALVKEVKRHEYDSRQQENLKRFKG